MPKKTILLEMDREPSEAKPAASNDLNRRRFIGTSLVAGTGAILARFLPTQLAGTRTAETAGCSGGSCTLIATAAHCQSWNKCGEYGCCGINIAYYVQCWGYCCHGGCSPDYCCFTWCQSWLQCCCWCNACGPCDGRSLGAGYSC